MLIPSMAGFKMVKYIPLYILQKPIKPVNDNVYISTNTEPVTAVSLNPCIPTPCGPNSDCRPSPHSDEQPVCSCLPNYIGQAPFCRPECTSSSECRPSNACINQRCQDPCQGSCGSFTTCVVNNHRPICSCLPGYTGDPFTECAPESKIYYTNNIRSIKLLYSLNSKYHNIFFPRHFQMISYCPAGKT